MIKLIQGDCLEKLKELEDSSIDSIVSDPPYELGFMGKKWDNTGIAYNVDLWKECLRVLKPGGHLLAFGGTRTYHRMAVAIEDAGFEVRDMIEWVYGSGFPKSLNIGKAVDKIQGNERIYTGEIKHHAQKGVAIAEERGAIGGGAFGQAKDEEITKGTSEWEGLGTALKPAHEPIIMARKPLAEKTVAENCLKWGTGGINIDESRVATTEDLSINGNRNTVKSHWGNSEGKSKVESSPLGRFPANLIHDNSEEVRECFPETKSIKSKITNERYLSGNDNTKQSGDGKLMYGKISPENTHNDSGNASRFFKSIIYQAKASKSERNKGLDGYLTVKYNECISNNKNLCKEENMVAVELLKKVISANQIKNFSTGESGESIMVQCHKDSLSTTLTEINKIIESKTLNSLMHSLTRESTQDVNLEKENGGNLAENVESLKKFLLTITKGNQELALGANRVALKMLSLTSEKENWKQATNFHSTVKPVALMEYLIKMVTPKNGTVLDPFMGSGTTGVACKNLNRNFIGIELSSDYFEIAQNRIEN